MLNGIQFIWNEEKAFQNLRKHGVSFEEAAEVFFDSFLQVIDASQNVEEREAVIGLSEGWNMLFVVYAELQEESIRIISAKEVTRQERIEYENG